MTKFVTSSVAVFEAAIYDKIVIKYQKKRKYENQTNVYINPHLKMI